MGKAFSFNAGDRGFKSRLRILTFFFFFFFACNFFFWHRLVGKELIIPIIHKAEQEVASHCSQRRRIGKLVNFQLHRKSVNITGCYTADLDEQPPPQLPTPATEEEGNHNCYFTCMKVV